MVVFGDFSTVVGTLSLNEVCFYVLAIVVVFLRDTLFEEEWWRGVDCLGALVKRVGVLAVSECFSSHRELPAISSPPNVGTASLGNIHARSSLCVRMIDEQSSRPGHHDLRVVGSGSHYGPVLAG